MPGGKIYLREDDGLVAMTEAPYDAEEILQGLLADYPDLLAGDQMRPSEPRRWLLISREAAIADTEGGHARWSLDHLFIDQDAVPTLVEVKRSSDTRLRREVVGQMLDYAANIVAYWPGGELRQLFEERIRPDGAAADDEVLRIMGGLTTDEPAITAAVDEFWRRAAANLAARRIRLVFVADVIPPELQRIVEFLNENLVRAEVLAVEVKQYVGEGRQTLVPRVIGRTAAAEDVKQASSGVSRVVRSWTEADFRDAARAVGGPDAAHLVDAVMSWNRKHGFEVVFGRGKYGPLYLQPTAADGTPVKAANVNTAGSTQIGYDSLAKVPPFDNVEARLALNERLNRITGVDIPERYAVAASWPSLRLEVLASEEARDEFLRVFDWVADRLAAGTNEPDPGADVPQDV
jgi:hypothetical protein